MDIQIPQIIFYLINFGVVAGALTYLLYKPVLKILDERAKKVEEGQKAAEHSLKEAQEASEKKAAVLQAAQKEAAEKVQEHLKKAQAQTKEMLMVAKQEAQAELDRANQEMAGQKSEMLKGLQKEFAEQVIATAEKVIGASLDKKAAAKIIDEDLATLSKRV